MTLIEGVSTDQVEFFSEAFSDKAVPEDVMAASIHLVRAYGLWGTSDPMYVANVIALHMGRGDGKGAFW